MATLFCIAAVLFFARDVGDEIDRLEAARSDNIQWTLSQIEVEFLEYSIALRSTPETNDAKFSRLRREFDVFYSRISTLNNGQLFSGLRTEQGFSDLLASVNQYLQSTATLMDQDDLALAASLPAIAETTNDIRPDVRSLANSGLNFFAHLADRQRTAVSGALSKLGYIVSGLIVLLCGLIVYLSWLNAQGQRRQREAYETNERIQTIISTSLDAVIVADVEGDILEFNNAAEDIFGHKAENVFGKNIGEVIVPEHFKSGHDAGMKRMKENGEKRVVGHGRVQLEAVRKNGEIFPVELAIQSAETEDGALFIAFLRDISEKVAAETELVAARDKALEGEKAKGEFLAVMSHEIRTPLNGLLGNLSLLKDTKIGKDQREYLANMETSGRLLLSHVTDVLDITRYDTGTLQQSRRAMSVEPFLQDLLDSQAGQAEVQNTKLEWTWRGRPVGSINSDPDLLQPVLLNLIGNAVKFTKSGTVRVEVEKMGGPEDEPELEFRVIDDGVGIEPEKLDMVFDDFVTGNISFNRSSGGTGLGLGIARRYAQALGGTLTVESKVGKGSTFTFRAPFQMMSQLDPIETFDHSTPVEPMNILVVEDNEINRQVVREMLNKMNHSVTEAVDGKAGVEAADGQAFDLIFMDITMPVMDGREATRAIRAGQGKSSNAPIVALTANVVGADREAFLSDGMNDVLSKPISKAKLAEILSGASAPKAVDEGQLEELLELLGSDRFEETLSKFKNEGHAYLDALPRLTGEQLVEQTHKFAGSAAMLCATQLHENLKSLENSAKSETLEKIEERKTEVIAAWQKTLQDIG
ncbi:PAS domain-containing hybrid sensor histidine kinase/response regulator [Loktanella sp. Alg231-35]|uniref:PAS domain-containing hybrid sensor histidine kinase/response regulator n=1 Tax=Loktanella sp. Alg231-35 TaxID=1922220 RepID=UPI00131EF293|nr:PAS domain-containing hybrid sensor histidine kinase/response regulator [Loktanella sp. Alg231-35]